MQEIKAIIFSAYALTNKKLSKGKSLEQIADEPEEEPAKIQQICDAAADFTPDYDTLEILDMLLEEEEE